MLNLAGWAISEHVTLSNAPASIRICFPLSPSSTGVPITVSYWATNNANRFNFSEENRSKILDRKYILTELYCGSEMLLMPLKTFPMFLPALSIAALIPIPAATPHSAIRLCPHACPISGKASYSHRTDTWGCSSCRNGVCQMLLQNPFQWFMNNEDGFRFFLHQY